MNNDDYYNGNESSKTTLKITINSDDSSVDAKPLNKPVHSGRAVHNGKELKIDKK
jgi:hypothetical protein